VTGLEPWRSESVNFGKGHSARQALDVAGDDPVTLANAAYALAYFGEDVGGMIGLVDRALTLNPSFARRRMVDPLMFWLICFGSCRALGREALRECARCLLRDGRCQTNLSFARDHSVYETRTF
jgi:hypothetical protein